MKKAYKDPDFSNIARLLAGITDEDETRLLNDLSRFGMRRFFANIDSLGYAPAIVEKLGNIDELARNLLQEDLKNE